MSFILWCFFCLLIQNFSSVLTSREEEGYPQGLMTICPGTNKPAEITRSHLKYLLFLVQGKGRSRQKYTYWNAKNIATDPRIDFKRKTILLVGGYLDSTSYPSLGILANEYEDRNYNVILLDTQRFTTVHYFLAVRLTRPVGKHTAEVLVELTKAGLDPSKVEILGYSIGGQTISYIAKNFQAMTGRNISRITSLDPTGACFRNLGPDERLAASDADFVQVMHLNIDGFGMAARMGHVDFYVNGGEFQPSDLNLYNCESTCSHFRLLPLWLSAMKNPSKFIAIKCDSIQQARDGECYDRKPLETNVMGLNVDTEKHGVFYLSTTKGHPYYLGKKGVKPEYAYWKRITDVNDGDELEIYVCPGSTKPVEIPRAQLKYLLFVVHAKGNSRKKYTYWNAKDIATDPRIDFKRKTVVISTGYLDSPNFIIARMFANEYADRGYNVILVDCQRFITVHFYLAVRFIRTVGKHVAEVLVELTKAGMDPSTVELLGYSLGGQTISFIASNYQKLTGRNLGRITGLDPTGPCFRALGPEHRLNASNADFVQVIHANIDGYGMASRMGHVDFYVNGGEYQPSDLNLYYCDVVCSHFRVFYLWFSALKNPNKFIGIKCDSIPQARDARCYDRKPVVTNVMGLEADTKKHGIFYLSTSSGYPYFLGKNGLKPEYVYWNKISNINDDDAVEIYT